ncbi:MAG: Histidine--tRNA ligase [Bacteroidota bacterium]|nr:MAG: Histidine--tRNA ligase [Bacteroidota bacterium]
MAQKPSIPKGTRDFLPADVARRSYVINTIRTHFERYGFLPIETPSMEKSVSLMGKYGEEGDRLMFHVLNSGEKIKKADVAALSESKLGRFTQSISEKALRYDLTVPFARFVAQHQHELSFPFKRYQVQSVWRADRPQRGRFQEFTQCDADVVGAVSPVLEAECIQLFDSVFHSLHLKGATIRINHRNILSGIATYLGPPDRILDFTVALDKLDKIGAAGVFDELKQRGFGEDALTKLTPLLELSGSIVDQLDILESLLKDQPMAIEGIAHLRDVLRFVSPLHVSNLAFDLTLARGLNYYTGIIFEVAPPKTVDLGSIGAGGRYDDLTALFGLKEMHGLGISFGLDRLCMVLEELDLYPSTLQQAVDVIVLHFGDAYVQDLIPHIAKWRNSGLRVLVYPTSHKLKKQMQFANQSNAPWALFYGEEEQKEGILTVKNMGTGETDKINLDVFDTSILTT